MLNKIGITDKLASIYDKPAVMPFVGRGVASAPVPAQNVTIEGSTLKWNASGDVRSVVYYFSDLKKEGEVMAVTTDKSITVSATGHYSVSVLNRDNVESEPSDVIEKK